MTIPTEMDRIFPGSNETCRYDGIVRQWNAEVAERTEEGLGQEVNGARRGKGGGGGGGRGNGNGNRSGSGSGSGRGRGTATAAESEAALAT